MILMSRPVTLNRHHAPADKLSRRHSGIYTVTPTPRAAAGKPTVKRGSPFGELILGPDAGMPPTAYQPILLRA